MMYPLVRDLAAGGVPVAVACRVLKIARQSYCRWLAAPIAARELDEAYLANILFDAHTDDPEFGHRLLADEAARAGQCEAPQHLVQARERPRRAVGGAGCQSVQKRR